MMLANVMHVHSKEEIIIKYKPETKYPLKILYVELRKRGERLINLPFSPC